MRKITTLLLLTVWIGCSGCALKVLPDPTATGTINPRNNSQTITKDNIAITVSNGDAELSSYNLENFVTSFAIDIENLGQTEVSFDADSFILLDDENRQYNALTADKVRQILTKDSYYLLPYPYVGFYYLEDYEKASYKTSASSNLPYYYEVYPQDIYTKALPSGAIIPKAKVSGLVYFRADLARLKSVRLLIFMKGTPKSADPDFVFPFRIVK
jgi:hypothetical protein